MNVDQDKVDEDYLKILNVLNGDSLKLGRQLLNASNRTKNSYGVFNDPLYACLSNYQFFNIISYNDNDIVFDEHKIDAVESLSRNKKFITNYHIEDSMIKLKNPHLKGELSYELTNTDMNRRKRRFILDLCLL